MATRTYDLISADGHFNEPGDLWTSRCPEKFRSRAPRMERLPEGDAWILEGCEDPLPFGWGACAGRNPEDMGPWCRMEDINPGSYDPKARIAENDADRIQAEVLFPSGWPTRSITASTDPDYHHAMVRCYNDFVSEFCSYAPDRLGGAALLPSRGVAGAVEEARRVLDMNGFVAFLLTTYPNGSLEIEPEDDALWGLVEESGMPLTIHVSLGNQMPGKLRASTLPGTVHFYDAPQRMLQFIFGGVLDRFPGLTIVMAEVDMGWMPYFAEQADDNYLRHSRCALRDINLPMLPSEYMARHFPASFITDHYAIENRHRIGVERMLWSNDYPHITSDWPYSWKTINASFAGVDPEERRLMLRGNAERIFGFGS